MTVELTTLDTWPAVTVCGRSLVADAAIKWCWTVWFRGTMLAQPNRRIPEFRFYYIWHLNLGASRRTWKEVLLERAEQHGLSKVEVFEVWRPVDRDMQEIINKLNVVLKRIPA